MTNLFCRPSNTPISTSRGRTVKSNRLPQLSSTGCILEIRFQWTQGNSIGTITEFLMGWADGLARWVSYLYTVRLQPWIDFCFNSNLFVPTVDDITISQVKKIEMCTSATTSHVPANCRMQSVISRVPCELTSVVIGEAEHCSKDSKSALITCRGTGISESDRSLKRKTSLLNDPETGDAQLVISVHQSRVVEGT